MKLSIGVCTFNCQSTIGDTLKRLQDCDRRDFEVLMFDGGSDDGTVQILEEFDLADDRFRLCSRSDSGLFDALNQFAGVAGGQYMTVCHSGDIFAKDWDKLVFKHLEDGADVIALGAILELRWPFCRCWPAPNELTAGSSLRGCVPAHTAVIIKTSVAKLLEYDDSWSIASDFRFMIQLAQLCISGDCRYLSVDDFLVKMSFGGLSTNPKNLVKKFKQDVKIIAGYAPLCTSIFSAIFKAGRKLLQLRLYSADLKKQF